MLNSIEVSSFVYEQYRFSDEYSPYREDGVNYFSFRDRINYLNSRQDIIRLGANICHGLDMDYWNIKHTKSDRISALEWLFVYLGVNFIEYSGAIIRNEDGEPTLICHSRNRNGNWSIRSYHLFDNRAAYNFADQKIDKFLGLPTKILL